jgi:hypothetical protein
MMLVAAGHDVSTVTLQRMESEPDAAVIEACRREGRALVTLDLDFANPLDYRPSEYAGIAVLRLPKKPRRKICSRPSRHLLKDWSKTRSPENCGSSRKDASAFISKTTSLDISL